MPLGTLALLAAVFFTGASAFALARREEIDRSARILLAAPAALSSAVLIAMGAIADPSDALPRAALALAAPLGLLALALALARSRPALARAAAVALALASLPLVLLDAIAPWADLVLATALAAALARPPREPWARAALGAWTTALAAIVASPLADRSLPALAASVVALAGLALSFRCAQGRVLWNVTLAIGLALGVAAAWVSPAFVLASLIAPSVLASFAFLRGRALGASSRPLAATSAGYAAATLADALGAPSTVAFGVGVALGSVVLAGLEILVPSLDETRARRAALAREDAGATDASTRPLQAGGRILGRYRLLERLGEGTFGTAFLARDEVAGERVVVKALRTGAGEDRRVLREARSIATVRHPNVVELRDVIEDQRRSFLVMEFAEGGSLAQRLEAGPLDQAEVLRVGLGVLDALAAVHQAGIVHRDVKPSNVLLTRAGVVKLADFGLARATDADATLAPGPLAPAVGTLRYMAPELARGRPAGVASDLYSAAATLYECLTGRPYVETKPNESAVEIQMRVASMGAFAERLEADELRGWFERALDPDPESRFASAREARDALAAIAALGA